MRVLFLCNSRLYRGAERYTVSLARGLAGRGHTCFLAAPPGSSTLDAVAAGPGITGLPFEPGPATGHHAALDATLGRHRCRRRLEAFLTNVVGGFGIDVLHVQFRKEQLLATPAAAALGLPVVWSQHDHLSRFLRVVPTAMRRYRRAAASVDRILCGSADVFRDVAAHGFGDLTVCYNGVDPGTAPNAADCERVRGRLGLDTRDFVVGCTARLAWTKGQRHLLHATDVLRARIPRLHLLLVGDGAERDSLERLTAQLDLTRHVRFLGHRDDARDLLPAFDVFAAPSLSDGLPLAILEAMAAARPVIATRVGGIPEALDDGDVGLLIEPGTAGPLVGGIDRLYRDSRLRSRLGKAARARVVEWFSIDAMIDRAEPALLAAAGVTPVTVAPLHAALAS